MPKKNVFLLLSIAVICAAITFTPRQPAADAVAMIDIALKAHKRQIENPRYAILIDYRKPVYTKRLWVIETKTKKTILNARVSHARRSGFLYARKYSNQPDSRLSCTGAFLTMGDYKSNLGRGKYQIGMQIRGLDKGINDNALMRRIVFHPYWLPFWSSGCFMTYPRINKKIIDTAKNGNMVIVVGYI